MKKALRLFAVIFVFAILSSAVFASRTYVIYESSKSNTYVVPHKFSGKSEVVVLRQKANKLNPVYYEIYERNEEKERLLEKKFRRVKVWFNNKFYIGYNEEFFGSKKLYLNWRDVKSTEDEEYFHPTKGYKCLKGKTFSERIDKYSVK